jgi:ankyrin repeat protein
VLDKGVDVNIVDLEKGQNALYAAVRNNDLPMAKLLLSYGAYTQNRKNTLPFHCPLTHAVKEGNVEMCKLLLNKTNHRVVINQREIKLINGKVQEDPNSPTLLHLAVDSPKVNPSIIRILLEKGADVNAEAKMFLAGKICDNVSPLAILCNQPFDQTEAIKLLIKYKAHFDKKVGNNDTALTLSSKLGKFEEVKAILQAKPSFTKSSLNHSALLHATLRNSLETVEALLEYSSKNKDKISVIEILNEIIKPEHSELVPAIWAYSFKNSLWFFIDYIFVKLSEDSYRYKVHPLEQINISKLSVKKCIYFLQLVQDKWIYKDKELYKKFQFAGAMYELERQLIERIHPGLQGVMSEICSIENLPLMKRVFASGTHPFIDSYNHLAARYEGGKSHKWKNTSEEDFSRYLNPIYLDKASLEKLVELKQEIDKNNRVLEENGVDTVKPLTDEEESRIDDIHNRFIEAISGSEKSFAHIQEKWKRSYQSLVVDQTKSDCNDVKTVNKRAKINEAANWTEIFTKERRYSALNIDQIPSHSHILTARTKSIPKLGYEEWIKQEKEKKHTSKDSSNIEKI